MTYIEKPTPGTEAEQLHTFGKKYWEKHLSMFSSHCICLELINGSVMLASYTAGRRQRSFNLIQRDPSGRLCCTNPALQNRILTARTQVGSERTKRQEIEHCACYGVVFKTFTVYAIPISRDTRWSLFNSANIWPDVSNRAKLPSHPFRSLSATCWYVQTPSTLGSLPWYWLVTRRRSKISDWRPISSLRLPSMVICQSYHLEKGWKQGRTPLKGVVQNRNRVPKWWVHGLQPQKANNTYLNAMVPCLQCCWKGLPHSKHAKSVINQ